MAQLFQEIKVLIGNVQDLNFWVSLVSKRIGLDTSCLWINLHFASQEICVNAYASEAENMQNQAIRTALDGDFAMQFSPCMEVSPANAVRFSSNFIFLCKGDQPTYVKCSFFEWILSQKRMSFVEFLICAHMDESQHITALVQCNMAFFKRAQHKVKALPHHSPFSSNQASK